MSEAGVLMRSRVSASLSAMVRVRVASIPLGALSRAFGALAVL